MRDIYILNRSLGFFDSDKQAYYVLVSGGKVFAVNKVNNKREYIGHKIPIKTVSLFVRDKTWAAFPSMDKLKSYLLKKELDNTLRFWIN